MTTLFLTAYLFLPPLTISHVGDEVHVCVMARDAWRLEASADLLTWVEIAEGPAAPVGFAATVTIIRDNAAQRQVFYRVSSMPVGFVKE